MAMDGVLRRLQSIRQSIETLTTLSPDQEQKIEILLFGICTKLQEGDSCSKDTAKSLCEDVLFMLSEIESIFYLPVVDHLITRFKAKGTALKYNDESRAQHQDAACNPSQDTEVNKKSKNVVNEIESFEGDSATNDYWETRRGRIHSVLGNTSLRFDKKWLKRKKTQKSLSWGPCIARTIIELPIEDHLPKVSQLLRLSKKRAGFSQEDIDTFWGLTEDKCQEKQQKRWKSGETICVLNCKSELHKLKAFLKDKKAVRSFYIQRKPKGLAGCNGTWLTPPYSPPLVVKCGNSGKSSCVSEKR